MFRGASTLTFFLVWGILILNFKCLGSKKVGKLLAGDGQRTKNRVSTASVAFFICALLVIVFAFLLVEKGLSEMQNSITAVGYNDEIATHQNEFLTLSEDLKSMVNRAMSNFNELNRIFGHSMCPPNIDPTIQNGMIQIIDGILEVLKNANHVEDSKLTVLDDLIGMLNKTTAEMNGSLQQIQLSDFHVLGLLIPLLLLPLYFVGSILLRWTRYDIGNLQKAHYFFLWWIVLPLFVVTILFTIAAASSVTVGAIANADFCSGGPNKTPEVNVHALLDTNEATRSGLPNDIASFYVDQCTSNDTPFGFLEDYAHVLVRAYLRCDLKKRNAGV